MARMTLQTLFSHARRGSIALFMTGVLGMAAWAQLAEPLARASNAPQLNLPRVALSANMFRIDAQVAQSPQERQIGLMHRQTMPAHEGMLFVFEQAEIQCFWMKNTLLPLTAAFLADDGTVVNLADMQPLSEQSHCSTRPVRYVLEMNQGWFGERNIQAGTAIRGEIFSIPQPSH